MSRRIMLRKITVPIVPSVDGTTNCYAPIAELLHSVPSEYTSFAQQYATPNCLSFYYSNYSEQINRS